jgi:hypothetical protein
MHQNILDPARDRALAIDIRMKKYAILKSDQNMQATGFKNHVRNSQVVALVMIGLFGLMLKGNGFAVNDNTEPAWIFVALMISFIAFYLFHDTLESSFSVQALAERIASLEREINALCRHDVLIWESKIAPKLWNPIHVAKGIWHPIYCMMAYEIVLMIGVAIGLPGFVFYQVWILPKSTIYTKAILIVLSAVVLGSAWLAGYIWFGVNKRLRLHVAALIQSAAASRRL